MSKPLSMGVEVATMQFLSSRGANKKIIRKKKKKNEKNEERT
jgi:hypothetical protein